MRLPRWSTILLTLFVGACALFRSDPAKQLDKLTTAFRDEAAASSRLDPVRGKVSFIAAREATPAMLALAAFPTDAEKRALEEWQGMSRYWQLRANRQIPKTSAWTIPILEASRAASLALLARLHAAGIDYGQFNRERLELAARTDETIQARAEELKAGTGPQSPAASAAISTFQNALLRQGLVDRRMQPIRAVPFPCTRSGRKASCF
jgi:hypothetical protein